MSKHSRNILRQLCFENITICRKLPLSNFHYIYCMNCTCRIACYEMCIIYFYPLLIESILYILIFLYTYSNPAHTYNR